MAFVVMILLLVGAAVAEKGAGVLGLEGPIELPAGTAFSGEPALMVLRDTQGLTTFRLTAPTVTLRYVESVYLKSDSAPPGGHYVHSPSPLEHSDRTSILHDVHVETKGLPKAGFLVVDTVWGKAEGTSHRLAGVKVAPAARTVAENEADADAHPAADARPKDEPQFRHEFTDPHLIAEGPGRVRFHGGAILTLWGPDVTVRSSGEVKTYPTGRTTEGLGRERVRWVEIEFGEGDLEASTTSPWLLVTPHLSLSWDGEAAFRPAAGELRTADHVFRPAAADARLRGRFDASASLVETADGLLTRLALQGDVLGTTMEGRRVAAPQEEADPPVLLTTVAVVAGLGFGGGLLWARRVLGKPPAPSVPYTAEDCMVAVDRAMAAADWPAAAEWLRRACALAPSSAALRADLAYAMMELGQPDEAAELFRQAERLGPLDGEAYLHAAVACVRAAQPAHEAEEWLDKALSARPALVADLEDVEELAPLLETPSVARRVDLAWIQFSEDGPDPD